jgi:uncharacterized membrane protein YcaP (DUF421 family)
MGIINILIGEGQELNSLQMGIRSIIIFLTALLMLRIAGIRTFGKKTAFDNVIIIILGSVLSRAITGASPFIPTIFAGLVLVVVHRVLAILAYKSEKIGKLIKGEKALLFSSGAQQERNMRETQISHNDIMEEVRIQINQEGLEGIKKVFIEPSGHISIIKENGV